MWVYGMRERGYSLGCQPKFGFIRQLDIKSKKYYDLIVYNRKLSEDELEYYSLDFVGTLVDLKVD
jgi:hypothetical protein